MLNKLKEIKHFLGWALIQFRMYISPLKVKFYNHWSTFLTEKLPHKMWFYRFIQNRGINTKMTFFSVEGYRWFIKIFPGKKVFFTAEYVQQGGINPKWLKYSDNCVDFVDLSLGYDYLNHSKYMRFPLWIMYFVRPEMTFKELEAYIEKINSPAYRLSENRNEFVCQISHHDKNGIREKMITLLNQVDEVKCAGSFMNNTDELKAIYHDNKYEYLKKFKFNICPENFSAQGYITEKIFDAIVCGCIPIYWGGKSKEFIEPSIISPEAFLYYEEGKENELLEKVKELHQNKQAYEEFVKIPPFKENAAKIIWQQITDLENRLQNL